MDGPPEAFDLDRKIVDLDIKIKALSAALTEASQFKKNSKEVYEKDHWDRKVCDLRSSLYDLEEQRIRLHILRDERDNREQTIKLAETSNQKANHTFEMVKQGNEETRGAIEVLRSEILLNKEMIKLTQETIDIVKEYSNRNAQITRKGIALAMRINRTATRAIQITIALILVQSLISVLGIYFLVQSH